MIIHPKQTSFIRGRSILNGTVVLHEIWCEDEETFVLKLDYEKAYDIVDWRFMYGVLLKQGFYPRWTCWMMNLVKGSQTTININVLMTILGRF